MACKCVSHFKVLQQSFYVMGKGLSYMQTLLLILALVLPSAMFTQFDEFQVKETDTDTKFYVRILG